MDHRSVPIIIELHSEVSHNPVFVGQAKWKSKDMNWKPFMEAVEAKAAELEPTYNIYERTQRFNNILIDCGKAHVGKVKPGKNTKSWMTPTVRAALGKRNKLRRRLKSQKEREEWLKAYREAQEEIKKAKENSWKETLEDIVTEADDTKMWRLIKSLNGTPCANSTNEVMVKDGVRITDDRQKANIFTRHYADVSRITFSKEDRDTNRKLKQTLSSTDREDHSNVPLTLTELKTAIKKMKTKGAAGPDDIPPSFLKNLGPIALEELLAIFNLSLESATCPQVWRSAIIIPLLKAGKPASKLDSYRPISLTSCVVKAFERIIAERLYNYGEKNGLFSHLQAGFRKGRSCEDQILKIVQAIEDGFDQKKHQRSVLVLLDFSKAYDTVWRQKLLLSMIDDGVPMYLIRWLYGFLRTR